MAKLNQIIAVANGKKTHAESVVTKAYHTLQKGELFNGESRTYQSRSDDGDKLPSEMKRIQANANELVKDVSETLTTMYDIVATQDWTNRFAKADIMVEGQKVVEDVPPTTMLFLEKQLENLATFISALPTLDPSEEWRFDENRNCFVSAPAQKVRTKKVPRSVVVVEPTEHHRAEIRDYTEDVPEGDWTILKFSSAIPAKRKEEDLERVRKLRDAVKAAREEANLAEVEDRKIGESIFKYIFGN